MHHSEMPGMVSLPEQESKEPTLEVADGKERKRRLPLTLLLIIIAFLAARGFIDSEGVDQEQFNQTPITVAVDGEEVTVDGSLAADALHQLPTITELAGVELDYDPALFSSPGPSDEFIEARRHGNK